MTPNELPRCIKDAIQGQPLREAPSDCPFNNTELISRHGVNPTEPFPYAQKIRHGAGRIFSDLDDSVNRACPLPDQS